MRLSKRLLPLVAALCASTTALAADVGCADERPTTGRYRNYSYGFTVVIPKGLEGWWNSARCVPQTPDGCICMGDHGRSLPLPGGGSISIDAAPEVFEATLATAAYKDLHGFEARTEASELALQRFEPRRLRALASYRFIATSVTAGAAVVRESVHVLLPSGGYVAISIEAPQEQYRKYHPAYTTLLGSLRPSSRR
ncbi:hypothetical protein ACG04R_02825 [Roseateles sp. BYS78W]|uniref:Uncharacterized protein n=2 Tax=Pelomonas candidula TaxID=3299025 RepID=A0ABW7H7U4_9BURK